ncbi:MAG: hypothetical protein R3304_11050 [Longimicrobiales bacterium]|nr:hypothetical protein [Longimicrobiales bacterium]
MWAALALLGLAGSWACGAEEPEDGTTGERPGEASPSGATMETDAAAAPDVLGEAPPASQGIPSVVLLEPSEGRPPTDAGERPTPVVDQFGLAFIPRVLVVPEGTPVTFTNSEGSLTHNVHIRSLRGDSTVFNGDSAPGEALIAELPEPGGYDVLCDMHPGMTGFLFVSPAPYAVAADADGAFRFDTVPPGRYLARLWTIDGGFGEGREISVGDAGTRIELKSAG